MGTGDGRNVGTRYRYYAFMDFTALKGGAKKIQPEHWKYLLILGGLGYFVSIILQLGGTAPIRFPGIPDQLPKPGGYFHCRRLCFKGADHLEECSQHRGLLIGCLHHSWKRQHGDQHDGRSVFHWIRGILWSAASVSIRKISGYYDPVQTALYGMVIALVFNVPAAVIENVFVTRSHPTAVGHRRMPVCGSIWYGGGTHFAGIRPRSC